MRTSKATEWLCGQEPNQSLRRGSLQSSFLTLTAVLLLLLLHVRPALAGAASTAPIATRSDTTHPAAANQTPSPDSHAHATPTAEDSWVFSNNVYQPLNFLQQPFIGNGYLGLRIPALGAGYQGTNLGKSGFPLENDRYTSALVAGVYANMRGSDFIASLPNWSQMDLSISQKILNPYTPPSQISHYRQTLDMRTGVVTTSLLWTPSPGRATWVRYTVLANRAHMHLGEVQLCFRPAWSGFLTLNASLNGHGAQRITASSRAIDLAADSATLTLKTPGRGTVVVEQQILLPGKGVIPSRRAALAPAAESATAGVQWVIPVTAGHTYQILKYVGISTSNDPGSPAAVADHTTRAAARSGWPALLAAQQAAWAALWSGDIITPGKPSLQDAIHASFYLLYSSIRAGLHWSIPPAGLSSDNYGGEIFWDADTWIFPSLLAFHPNLARPIVDFRYYTLAAARANARRAAYSGAMWAWDNGPSGSCGGLAPCSHYEDHLQSDIALAQWQYYQATGDRSWLASRGYPVIQAVAQFWISRVTLGPDHKYHINDVTGPDEFTDHVNDDAATNAGAAIALLDATLAAQALGRQPDPQWARVAAAISIPVDPDGTHPEYQGYTHQPIKQADAILMTYPIGYLTDAHSARLDLERYTAVTDPGGPAMTASVEGIIADQLRTASSPNSSDLEYTLLQQAYQPFIRGAFHQFLETRYLVPSARQGPPCFDFATGAGGFLQMFPFGFAGLRWSPSALLLAPNLPPQLSAGILLRGIRYQGRSLSIAIQPHTTTITLLHGPPINLGTPPGIPGGSQVLAPQHPARLPTFSPTPPSEPLPQPSQTGSR